MKTLTKIIRTSVILMTVIFFSARSQTNVSGGIYTNTIWTLANSPYIVTDTIVVFPNVTLTIDPGVIVKFADGKRIELRQATLIAEGTVTDSITFTSNSISPTPGIWERILFTGNILNSKFNYCNFKYAVDGIFGSADTVRNSNFTFNTIGFNGEAYIDSCTFKYNVQWGLTFDHSVINNCKILHNQIGIVGSNGSIKNCLIDSNQTGAEVSRSLLENCTVNYNQTGIEGLSGNAENTYRNCIIESNSMKGIILSGNDSLVNCEIKFNGIGVDDPIDDSKLITRNIIENNSVGIQLGTTIDNIYCNRICNNSSYDLQYTIAANGSVANNYWCTADSISTETVIYDGYDNISLGLVSFIPLDTSNCYLATGISIFEDHVLSFNIFPNPANDYLKLELPAQIYKAKIYIINMLGELEYSSSTTRQKNNIDISTLSGGMYIIEVATGNNIGRKEFIKQQTFQ